MADVVLKHYKSPSYGMKIIRVEGQGPTSYTLELSCDPNGMSAEKLEALRQLAARALEGK